MMRLLVQSPLSIARRALVGALQARGLTISGLELMRLAGEGAALAIETVPGERVARRALLAVLQGRGLARTGVEVLTIAANVAELAIMCEAADRLGALERAFYGVVSERPFPADERSN